MSVAKDVEPRRAVVTGVGMYTNLGPNSEQSIDALLAGKSGLSQLSFEHPVIKLGGEIKDFDPKTTLIGVAPSKSFSRIPFAGFFALKATHEALGEAGLLDEKGELTVDRETVGVYIGTGVGGMFDEDVDHPRRRAKEGRTDPFAVLHVLPDRVPSAVEIRYGVKGSTFSQVAACASSGVAIGAARERIVNGHEKIIIAGGAESTIVPRFLNYFDAIGALSKSQDMDSVSIPFDENRNGFIMAEGAATIIVEELQHALSRGAVPLAEIVGFGTTSDGGSNETLASGNGLQRAMEQALRGVEGFPRSGEIYVVKPHATATPQGDELEVAPIQALFPNHKQVFAHASKGAGGHSLGASGAIASAEAIRGLQHGFIPPNLHRELMPGIDFNLSRDAHQINAALAVVNSSGFGGLNTALVFAPIRN